jgi:hypothetical protein
MILFIHLLDINGMIRHHVLSLALQTFLVSLLYHLIRHTTASTGFKLILASLLLEAYVLALALVGARPYYFLDTLAGKLCIIPSSFKKSVHIPMTYMLQACAVAH